MEIAVTASITIVALAIAGFFGLSLFWPDRRPWLRAVLDLGRTLRMISVILAGVSCGAWLAMTYPGQEREIMALAGAASVACIVFIWIALWVQDITDR